VPEQVPVVPAVLAVALVLGVALAVQEPDVPPALAAGRVPVALLDGRSSPDAAVALARAEELAVAVPAALLESPGVRSSPDAVAAAVQAGTAVSAAPAVQAG